MGSSYKEATHNNNVLYYKLHELVSIKKIVKFYKPGANYFSHVREIICPCISQTKY